MYVYVVTADGWREGYGSQIYLVGVYTDPKKAEETAKNITVPTIITKAVLDKAYPLTETGFMSESCNSNYLGGYYE